MYEVELFIQDMVIIMFIVGIVIVVFNKLKQLVVLGYIVVGVIIGLYMLFYDLIQDEKIVYILLEFGVIFLLFLLGLEFSLKKLVKVGVIVFIVVVVEILLMIWIGYEIGFYFGWKCMDVIFFGVMLVVFFMIIIVKVLNEFGMKNEKFVQIIFGILIVEDIFVIGMIVLFLGVVISGLVDFIEVFIMVGKLVLFMMVFLVVGIFVVLCLLSFIVCFKSNEMLLVVVLGVLFGFCLLVMKL